MIYKVLQDGRIWIQFILVEGSPEEKFKYSEVLSKYGTYEYTEEDIIEFISRKMTFIPSLNEARNYVESINDELDIAKIIEA